MNARAEFTIGLLSGLSNEAYHAGPGVGNSVLGYMAESPAHCYAMTLAPGRPHRSSAAFQAGTLAHCAVLEPDELDERYVVLPDDAPKRPTQAQWNAKKPSPDSVAAMEWWTEFNQRCAKRIVVERDLYDVAQHQRNAVDAVPEIAALLSEGEAEVSAFWIDERTGLQCKCRPDWVHPLPDGRVILFDLKTTRSVNPRKFAKSVVEYGYHRQAAWYSGGFQQASGREVAAFVFGAVAAEYPFIAVPFMLDDMAMEKGRAECRLHLDRYAQCLAADNWPAYGDGVQLLSLPAWAI